MKQVSKHGLKFQRRWMGTFLQSVIIEEKNTTQRNPPLKSESDIFAADPAIQGTARNFYPRKNSTPMERAIPSRSARSV
jgi:hypothetical protein